MTELTEEIHETRAAASRSAAARLAAALRRRLAGHERAALVASGGTTPAECLTLLGAEDLDWRRVVVTLSDERWVAPGDADSIERMIRETLLKGPAAAARFVRLYRPGSSCADALTDVAASVRALPSPFAGVLLGMGEDGHFASLFPDASGLATALDPDATGSCVCVDTAASPHRRISLTLRELVRTDEVLLLIFGARKREVWRAAAAGEPGLPVAALARQQRTPLRVIWAP